MAFEVDLSRPDITGLILDVQKVQNKVPESKCLGCPSKGGIGNEVVADCCRKASPAMYYIEFLNVLRHIESQWPKERRRDLLMSCIETFLNTAPEKPCVLLDQATSGCNVYKYRWTNCRTYGMIPDAEWETRARAVVAEAIAPKFTKLVKKKVTVQKEGGLLGLNGNPMTEEVEMDTSFTDSEALETYVTELFEGGFNPDAINARLESDHGVAKLLYRQCRNLEVKNFTFALDNIDTELKSIESKLVGADIRKIPANPTYLPFHTYFILQMIGEGFTEQLMKMRFACTEEEKKHFLSVMSENVDKMFDGEE